MKYILGKMEFLTGVHIGNGSVSDAEIEISADTLFSAICHECIDLFQEEGLKRLIGQVKEGKFLFSNVMPYQEDELYIPQPMIEPTTGELDYEDIKERKKLTYLPSSLLQVYMNGGMKDKDFIKERKKFESIGARQIRTRVAPRDENGLYNVGVYQFQKGCGLYVLIGYEDERYLEELKKILKSLGVTGIGGKRSSGLGKFKITLCEVPEYYERRLDTRSYTTYMTLTNAFPKETELQSMMEGAVYQLKERSGYISSMGRSATRRKSDFYLFQAGSCFKKVFEGDVFDVSNGYEHAVYRYAKPIMLGVS